MKSIKYNIAGADRIRDEWPALTPIALAKRSCGSLLLRMDDNEGPYIQ